MRNLASQLSSRCFAALGSARTLGREAAGRRRKGGAKGGAEGWAGVRVALPQGPGHRESRGKEVAAKFSACCRAGPAL